MFLNLMFLLFSMRKQAKDLVKGEKILVSNQECVVNDIEISEIGKHGKRKCRLDLATSRGDKLVIIRPEDYPVDTVD
jgi:translation elongation factor P/translation initiation factor 5A